MMIHNYVSSLKSLLKVAFAAIKYLLNHNHSRVGQLQEGSTAAPMSGIRQWITYEIRAVREFVMQDYSRGRTRPRC